MWYNAGEDAVVSTRWGSQLTEQVWPEFQRTVGERVGLAAGGTVVVGVSGGPDSLCLLHLFRRLREEGHLDVALVAAHLDHRIRPDSGSDARFVAGIAENWGIPFVGGAADVPAMAEAPGVSLEEAARVARYRFLRETAERRGAAFVAVAHNADDQVETVLMHLLRGTGLAGLRGMRHRSRLAEMRLGDETALPAHDVDLIRPLLGCRRAEIEEYCRQQGLQPLSDPTNTDMTIFRNRLRHELIPYLESYNPNIRAVVTRMADVVANDYDYLRAEVSRAWGETVAETRSGVFQFDQAQWDRLHPSLQAGLLREAVRRLRRNLRNINWVHVDNALQVARRGEVGQRATLPGGLMLTMDYGRFWVSDECRDLPGDDYPALVADFVPLQAPGSTPVGDGRWTLVARVTPRDQVEREWRDNPTLWRAYLDAERVDLAGLGMRVRAAGDWFCPLGMGGKCKDVREFMIGIKLPQAARRRYPLVVAGRQIVWIPGGRLDDRARIDATTRRVLILEMVKSLDAESGNE